MHFRWVVPAPNITLNKYPVHKDQVKWQEFSDIPGIREKQQNRRIYKETDQWWCESSIVMDKGIRTGKIIFPQMLIHFDFRIFT